MDRPKVLIVDDDPNVLRMMKGVLESFADYEVLVAASGGLGISMAHEAMPDVIILDLIMPGLDGEQVVDALRQSPETANIPVLLATSAPDVGEALQIPNVQVLGKPVDPEDLVERIEGLLG